MYLGDIHPHNLYFPGTALINHWIHYEFVFFPLFVRQVLWISLKHIPLPYYFLLFSKHHATGWRSAQRLQIKWTQGEGVWRKGEERALPHHNAQCLILSSVLLIISCTWMCRLRSWSLLVEIRFQTFYTSQSVEFKLLTKTWDQKLNV